MTYFIIFGLAWSATFTLMLGWFMVRKWWRKKGDDRDWRMRAEKVLKRPDQMQDYDTWEANRKMNLK